MDIQDVTGLHIVRAQNNVASDAQERHGGEAQRGQRCIWWSRDLFPGSSAQQLHKDMIDVGMHHLRGRNFILRSCKGVASSPWM